MSRLTPPPHRAQPSNRDRLSGSCIDPWQRVARRRSGRPRRGSGRRGCRGRQSGGRERRQSNDAVRSRARVRGCRRRGCEERERPGLHPLHVGLDRQAQGRDALARKRVRASSTGARRCSTPSRTIASAATRRSTSTCRSSIIYVCDQARRGALSHRRGARQGPAASWRASSRRSASRSGTRRRRSSTLLAQFGTPRAHDAFRACGWSCSPARCSRSSICARCSDVGRGPRYYNLYGPTETNVCTFAQIPSGIPDDRDTPYPIGVRLLALSRRWCSTATDARSRRGEEGLLYISRTVGVAGLLEPPGRKRRARSSTATAERWYNTGDVVSMASGRRASSMSAAATAWSSGAAIASSSARSSARSICTRGCAKRPSSRCRTRTPASAIVAFLSCRDGGEPINHRAEDILRDETAWLYEPRSICLPGSPAENVDRQGGLPAVAAPIARLRGLEDALPCLTLSFNPRRRRLMS